MRRDEHLLRRQPGRDVRRLEADKVRHAGADNRRLEAVTMADGPGGHEAAVAPATKAQAVGIGQPARDQRIRPAGEVREVAHTPGAPVAPGELEPAPRAATWIG